jgi:disulfide bond formation protein DsbB
MVPFVISIISWLALLGFVGLVAISIAFISDRVFHTSFLTRLSKFLNPYTYYLVFFLSFIASIASLFLSEVAHFPPCILCWYQRILMYPQPILYYLAIVRREHLLKPYGITLSVLGMIVSLYHYSLHVLPKTTTILLPCAKSYAGVPCDKGYNFFFGFMTFPLMAFVVFALITVVFLLSKPVAPPKRKK